MAPGRRADLVGGESSDSGDALDAVCRGLGNSPCDDVVHQPLRPVRPEASVATAGGQALRTDRVPHSPALSGRTTPAVLRVYARVLDDTEHDIGPSRIRAGNDGIYPDRDSVRRTRSGRRTWSGVRRVPADCTNAVSQAHPVSHQIGSPSGRSEQNVRSVQLVGKPEATDN